MAVITLLTDFGLKDGNVGVMKGIIWGIAPDVQIADLSHTIAPQNVPEAALILYRSAPYFPSGTVHLVVVDPGVGTDRRSIAARIGSQYFVGPDNGILTMWLGLAEKEGLQTQFVHLDRSEYWLPEVSHVFHGRDIFAPAAAYLASGTALNELGTAIDDPLLLELPQPVRTARGLVGEIIHIDHFGNISTNIHREHLEGASGLDHSILRLAGTEIRGMVRTFGDRQPGELVALFGSTGALIVSVVNGSAAQRLGIKPGERIELELGLSSERTME